ncbi:MAG: Na/Pi cotransporter family protein [Candidatus Caccosoma sp.]|nr:Na/Pi cotransporter family protein [Candidatus Caccosoma sp.]
MSITNVLTLVGGLALFLLGMNSMGDGLEKSCGDKMKKILEKLTSNRFIGVLVGMFITMIIQSSSATTVMVVGFVNASMMSLTQAVWVIMGANIGTTITGQLVALDIGWIAPLFAFIGVIMMLFIKNIKVNEIGKVLCGFGVLFIGLNMMSSSMAPLRENEAFIGLMSKFSNPLLGILIGLVFTAIIQSSSASVAILQALAISGVVSLDSAVYILFGQNIGTCATALLASIGTNRAAKRTMLIHLIFNVLGTTVFTIICMLTPLTSFVSNLTPSNGAQQIANMHTLFNVTTTLVLLPFGKLLVKLTEKILPDKEVKKEEIFMYLNNDIDLNVGGSALYLESTRLEVERMYNLAKENVIKSFDYLLNNFNNGKEILDTEDLVDKLNEGISKHITHCLTHEGNANINEAYSAYLTICTNVERLCDHSTNFYEHAMEFKNKHVVLNENVINEIKAMKDVCISLFDKADKKGSVDEVSMLEEKTDNMTKEYRVNMLKRLQNGICTSEGSIIYSEILIDFERVGDHLLNVSENFNKINV